MKELLIRELETFTPNVYLQGTLNENEAYPDSFITFWTNYTSDHRHYDNEVKSIEWQFSVIFYSNNPREIARIPDLIRWRLKRAGFIPQGKGADIPSDVITHTGWAMDFIKVEQL